MISTNDSEIRVWKFQQGTLSEITTLNGINKTITSLSIVFYQLFLIKQSVDGIKQKVKNGRILLITFNCRVCLILINLKTYTSLKEKLFQIKIWKVDFLKNQLYYQYSLK
ncbi:unnamed protein product (macronuclear) [Paramecium tetraurelia]|uniref:Uncharacterized protein n=1 Tax=Paramecium tetraurelia TaxID=5888 RepID=A0DZE1_PARTE|nr:uncharacterized protein GSPATT00021575001 [Paramecium tetraurelia]CAK88408.1 unnamed protein product [Paramecium tetraurelia]|eukprot:XP_001455805.1 hypothetical protein (macronuclear) [Paramecium tetraurelia strain d4-2]